MALTGRVRVPVPVVAPSVVTASAVARARILGPVSGVGVIAKTFYPTLDTSLTSGSYADYNAGVYEAILAGKVGASTLQRALVAADLSSLSGLTIISATLRLYCYNEESTDDQNVSVYRMLRQWWEGAGNFEVLATDVDGSTWNQRNRNGAVAWGAVGGQAGVDFATDPTATAQITGPGQWFEWDVTADVAAWAAGADNYGWFLRGNEVDANARKQFASSDYGSHAPEVAVVYSPF